MARRGTNVGSLYMDAHINGDDMNDEIVDGVAKAGPEVEKEGDRQGERFGSRFSERIRERLEKHAPRIARALDEKFDADGVGTRAGDGASASFVKRMSAKSKAIGQHVGSALGDDIGENIADRLEMSFAAMLDDLEDRIERMTKKVGASGGGGGGGKGGTTENYGPPPIAQQRLERAYRMDEEFNKARHLMVERAHQMNEEHDRQRALTTERAYQMNEDRDRQYAKMLDQAYKQNFEFDKKRHLMMQEAYRMEARYNAGRLTGDGRAKPGGSNVELDMPDRIGKFFGAGSRNNALNILGKSLGGILRMTERVRQGASSLFGTFITGARSAGQGANMLQRSMAGLSAVGARASAGLGSMFSSIAASGPAAAVAGLVLVGVLSAMASVVGALVGLVTALTAAIVGGLTAGLAVLGGAVLAVVAAGGLLTAAFMSMTNAQRTALKTAFEPLRDEVTGLGQVMMEQMVGVFPTWSANLQRAVALAYPAAQAMGGAFARAGSIITNSLSGPGFQRFATAMAVYLPGIVVNLSRALGGFLNGLTGMFSAIMPYVLRFAQYLNNVATRFSNWANSAQGQNTIVAFVERALVSLESLWGFTREFFGFLSDVLFSAEAQTAGSSMFDAMRGAFEQFRDAISSGDLERWFEDARNLGEALWGVLESLYSVFMALYDSGTIEGVALGLDMLASSLEWVGTLLEPVVGLVGWGAEQFSAFSGVLSGVPGMLANLLGPLGTVLGQLEHMASLIDWARGVLGMGGSDSGGIGGFSLGGDIGNFADRLVKAQTKRNRAIRPPSGRPDPGRPTVDYLRDKGRSARSNTYEKNGGLMADPKSGGSKAKPKYENPYEDWANSLIRQGPAMKTEIREAVRLLRTEGYNAIKEASKSTDHAQLGTNLLTNVNDMRKQGGDMVKTAQNALNSAARSLASASTPEAAKAALKEVRKAQSDLKYAQKQQRRLDKASEIINKQRYANSKRAGDLMRGLKVQNATLADYALARETLAVKIDEANQKLTDAIAMRDDYKTAVTDAAKAFAALTGAQAKLVDGVEQAITASDITTHLSDRLNKMREFQKNLQLLLAMGLSNDAYKQIVDAGVDGGAAYAQALVDGGVGAVGQVNSLTSQINTVAEGLGKDASTRMYQAGVDAAQGLVDGLTKLDKQLEAAAAALGNKIAAQVKKALGIKSPSRVAIDLMGHFGDGLEGGLDEQHLKVGRAANRLAGLIAIAPGGPTVDDLGFPYGGVSGNQKVRDVRLTVVTPTKDPVAAAHEAVNELIGRL